MAGLMPEGAGSQPLQEEPPSAARQVRLPLSRVKTLMKADPDVTLASQEAVLLTARATEYDFQEYDFLAYFCKFLKAELFVETIAKDAYIYAQRGKRKTLQRKDLDNAIEAIDEFAFLEGTLD